MILPCLLGYLFLVALSAAFSLVFLCVCCVFYYFCVHLLSSVGVVVVVAVLHLLFIFVQSNCAFLALGWSLFPRWCVAAAVVVAVAFVVGFWVRSWTLPVFNSFFFELFFCVFLRHQWGGNEDETQGEPCTWKLNWRVFFGGGRGLRRGKLGG